MKQVDPSPLRLMRGSAFQFTLSAPNNIVPDSGASISATSF